MLTKMDLDKQLDRLCTRYIERWGWKDQWPIKDHIRDFADKVKILVLQEVEENLIKKRVN